MMKQLKEYQKKRFVTSRNKPEEHKKRIKPAGRCCIICGKDPYPNYFYCPSCHNRVGMHDEGGEAFSGHEVTLLAGFLKDN
jgi:hypothetical protein